MTGAAAPAREPAPRRAATAIAPARGRPVDPLAATTPALALQRCACGGGCPACRAKAAGLPALPIHPANDAYEREADRVADAAMAGGSAPAVSRLQRRASGAGSAGVAPPIVHEVLRSAGQPLDTQTRAHFEPRFGRGFGDVRVHTDTRAAESARAVDAVAYTVGSNLVFGAGAYRPGSAEGRRLIAHELTHVVQQGAAGRAVQRFQFADDCSRRMRSRITDGHALAENATAHAVQVLANPPKDVVKRLFDYYFGAGADTTTERAKIVTNYDTLGTTLKKDFTYHCPPDGEAPCKGTQAEVLDPDNVAVCAGPTIGFSREGMARLLVHETVRRAHGKLGVSNHNDAVGECWLAAYGDARTDVKHPIPYSCFASRLMGQQLAAAKARADAFFEHLWPGRDNTSYWTGTLSFDDGTPPVAVSVTLTTMLSGLDFLVMGSYTYVHPKVGATTGRIPTGDVKWTFAPGQPERVTVSFEWVEGGSSSGRGYWNSAGANVMAGRWGRNNSSLDGGEWKVSV